MYNYNQEPDDMRNYDSNRGGHKYDNNRAQNLQ